MANTKITTNVIADGAITSAKLDSSSLSIPSTATATTQSAGDNSTKVATTAYVETAVSNLVSAAPAALDTLDELAAALGDDANFATTVTDSLALKAPLASPDFTGNVQVGTDSGDAFNSGALFRGQTTGAGYIQMKVADTASGGILIGDTTDDFRGGLISYGANHGSFPNKTIIFANNEQAITASTSGVRLNGNSIARDPLHVHRASTGDCQIHMTNTSTGTSSSDGMTIFTNSAGSGIWQRENCYFRIATNNSERFRIQANGNVGINTSSPQGTLHVKNTSDSATLTSVSDSIVINHQSGTYTDGNYYGVLGFSKANSNGATLGAAIAPVMDGTGAGTDLTFSTALAAGSCFEKMRITDTGNVGIGTTNPDDLLTISKNAASDTPSLIVRRSTDTSSSGDFVQGIKFANGTSSFRAEIQAVQGSAYADNIALNFVTMAGGGNRGTRMHIGGTGNVGIGTTNPSTKFEIINSEANDVTQQIGNSRAYGVGQGTHGSALLLGKQESGTYQGMGAIRGRPSAEDSSTYGDLIFDTRSGGSLTEAMRIKGNGGNVGIGTDNPQATLDISKGAGNFIHQLTNADEDEFALRTYNQGSASSNIAVFKQGLYYSGTENATVRYHRGAGGSDGFLSFTTSGTQRFRIDPSGRFAMGNTPSISNNYILSIDSDASGQAAGIHFTHGTKNLYLGYNSTSATDNAEMWNAANGYLRFGTNNAERVRIDSSGRWMCGVTSAIDLGQTSVEFDGTTQNGVVYRTTRSATGSTFVKFRNSSNLTIGYIYQDGSTTVNYYTNSDYRLKENVVYDWTALDRLNQLKPARYNFIGDDNVVDGFIAHELQEVMPEVVIGDKDAVKEEDGVEVPDYQGVAISKLVPLLVKSVQELSAKVDTLEAEIEVLKNG